MIVVKTIMQLFMCCGLGLDWGNINRVSNNMS